MIGSNLFYANLLLFQYFAANLSFPQKTGALSTVNLTSVLSVNSPCRYHLVSNNISFLNLPTTRNVSLTLTRLHFSHSFRSQNDFRTLQFRSLLDKGWLCEIVILFVTIGSSNFTNSDAKSVVHWIST